MGLIKVGGGGVWGLKSSQEFAVFVFWETEYWVVKVVVRLVCAFDCFFFGKEDLILKRDLILSVGFWV